MQISKNVVTYFFLRNRLAYRRIRKLLKKKDHEEALHIFNTQIMYPNKIENQILKIRIIRLSEGDTVYLNKLEDLYNQYPDNILVATSYANALINLKV